MFKKVIKLVLIVLTGIAVYLGDILYSVPYTDKLLQSLTTLAVLYAVFQIALSEVIKYKISDNLRRYSARKAVSALFTAIFLLALLRIWSVNTQTLLVSYGLIAAGITISLQDFFKSFVGGMVIYFSGKYRIGDRIQIGEYYGDVTDIGLLYTTLLETKGWVDGDQMTGRFTLVPNGIILSEAFQNYTKDHDFIWDEICLPISYSSDWKKATEVIEDIVTELTIATQKKAQSQINRLGRRYYIEKPEVKVRTFVTANDNWIDIHVRYVTDTRKRRQLNDQIFREVLTTFKRYKSIQIASTTLEITKLPDLTIKKSR